LLAGVLTALALVLAFGNTKVVDHALDPDDHGGGQAFLRTLATAAWRLLPRAHEGGDVWFTRNLFAFAFLLLLAALLWYWLQAVVRARSGAGLAFVLTWSAAITAGAAAGGLQRLLAHSVLFNGHEVDPDGLVGAVLSSGVGPGAAYGALAGVFVALAVAIAVAATVAPVASRWTKPPAPPSTLLPPRREG
jgi:hypothetical protein